MIRPVWERAERSEEHQMDLIELLHQAEAQCDAERATVPPASVEAQRLRRASNAIAKARDFLGGKYDDEIRAQRDRSDRNIAAFTALQRVTGHRGMVFLPERDYAEELQAYCVRQGIAAPSLPTLGGYEH
jgi:hypothetical protein